MMRVGRSGQLRLSAGMLRMVLTGLEIRTLFAVQTCAHSFFIIISPLIVVNIDAKKSLQNQPKGTVLRELAMGGQLLAGVVAVD